MKKLKLRLQIATLTVLFLPLVASAQKGVTTLGFQYKPIVPNPIIGMYEQRFDVDEYFLSSVKQRYGFSFGAIVRQGITKNISLETGLGFTRRNYLLDFAVPDSGYAEQNNVRFIGYEIPISALVFIQLGKQVFMNTSLGVAMNYFPSEVKTVVSLGSNEYFSQEAARLNRVQGSMIANIGFELRTRESGYFYLGGSYNLPFADIITFAMSYEYSGGKALAIDNISGSYLTVDFRYYFHEKPNSEQKKKR